MLWVGVDVGGTFTDGVLYNDESKALSFAKAPSTPSDPTAAVIDVIDRLDVPFASIGRFVHGITIGTNAILQHRGAKVWMLVTKGYADVLEIARTNRTVLYDIRVEKPKALVKRTHALEVNERIKFDGTVLEALKEADIRNTIREAPIATGDAIAVCLLHSYAHPEHERRVAELVRKERPDAYVCTSSDVLAQFREYDRFNTTALNAYIGPITEQYLTNLNERLARRGYKGEIFITSSNGGSSTAARAARLPVTTVLSGPAGGVAAALHLGKQSNFRNVITCDMGGTSTDVCLIKDLEAPIAHEQFIAGYANRTPQLEINAVGAGGGSIAWLDAGDILMVGPQSAGASPGPACYGQGGEQPTVTDANLVLNRLSSETSLAGRIAMSKDLASKAMAPICRKLGLSDIELADGIIQIAVARMVSAIKQISITQGHDPRDFVLCAYGGAGPMHAAFIAEELEIDRIIAPLGPGNFAALGSIISDVRRDYVISRRLQSPPFATIEDIFANLEKTGRADLIAEGAPSTSIEVRKALGMRYIGQSWELEVQIPSTVQSHEALDAAFSEIYQRRFGQTINARTEIVTFRLTVVSHAEKPEFPVWSRSGTASSAKVGERLVYLRGAFVQTPVFDRNKLPVDEKIVGAAIIEESGSTTIVPANWQASVEKFGHLILERR